MKNNFNSVCSRHCRHPTHIPLRLLFYLFTWLQMIWVWVAANGILDLCCCRQNLFFFFLQLRHVGSSSLTGDQTLAPCIGSSWVLAIGPPGKSPSETSFNHFCVPFPQLCAFVSNSLQCDSIRPIAFGLLELLCALAYNGSHLWLF